MKETPHFIFKPKVLEKNYKEFEKLCDAYLKNYVIAYSVKTNGFGGVINILDEQGSNFEVASMDEIIRTPEKAKVFNGSCKTEEELKIAIERKFLINIDSTSEIDKISKLLNGNELNISLRVSLNESKFGFEDRKLDEVIEYCSTKKLKVIGLSFHAGTQKNLRDIDNHLKDVKTIVSRILKLVNLKYIDIGGGFPDKIQMKNLKVNLEDYFRLINFNLVNEEFKNHNLKIIVEPGRFLVADAFDLITKVCVIKNNFTKNYAILDAGINILSKITLARYKLSKIDKYKEENKEYILAGPLLFGNDIIGKYTGNLKEGDLIKVQNVGAYCYNLAWEISYKKPKVFIEE